MTPGSGVFVAQATPWSPATKGGVTADLIAVGGMRSEDELAAWKGKLRGKVILYGRSGMSPEVNPDEVPRMLHDDAAKLAEEVQYPISGSGAERQDFRQNFEEIRFQGKVAKFFAEEGAVAVLTPGGSVGVLYDDSNFTMGWYGFKPDRRQAIPQVVMETEGWNKLSRLLDRKVPVTVRINIETCFDGEHAEGYNTIAEIAGTDPLLKDEVVMVGGHLDSWIAGTGATDNGAGVVVAMEAMRILNRLHVQPRLANMAVRIDRFEDDRDAVEQGARFVDVEYRRLSLLDDVLGAADGVSRVDFEHLAGDERVEEHRESGQLLLDRGRRTRPGV